LNYYNPNTDKLTDYNSVDSVGVTFGKSRNNIIELTYVLLNDNTSSLGYYD